MQPINHSELSGIPPAWQAVCHIDDLISGMGVTARVHGHQVAIFRTEEGVFALDNLDPFSRAAVLARGIVGDVQGRMVVASPMYKQHFCLRTGQCLEDESVSVQCWPLRQDAAGLLYAGQPQHIEVNDHACA